MEPSSFEKNIKSYRYKSSQYVSIPETIYEEPVNAFKSTKSYKDMSMIFDMDEEDNELEDDIDKFNKYHQSQIDRIIIGINLLGVGVIMALFWIM
jgi:acyl CoA:acetate/3-ketoacid CoA transferase